MNYFEIIPNEILNQIINEFDLINFPNLSLINKYFNNINFPIESKLNLLNLGFLIDNNWSIKFILLDKWSSMIYSQNPGFILSKRVNYHFIFGDTILFEVIKKNLTLGLQILLDYIPKMKILPQPTIKIILQHDYFSYIKPIKHITYINQPLLVLILLYGTEDILNLLLDKYIIKNINNNKIFYSSCDVIEKNSDESQNLLDFIDNMILRNKWNNKTNIYKKVSLNCLMQEITDDNIQAVKFILNTWDKHFFESIVTQTQYNTIPHCINSNIIDIIHKFKIKFGLLFTASPIRSKLNQIKNWYYSETMLKTVFDNINWSEEDIELIKEIDKRDNFGISERIFL
jgi:hypothetical protein